LSSREKELKGKETTLSERNNEQKQKSWTSGQPENDSNVPGQKKKNKTKFNNKQPQLMKKENEQQTTNNQPTAASCIHCQMYFFPGPYFIRP